jgi:signal transduction histidine kinase
MRWDSLSPMYQTPVNLRLPHTDNFIRFRFAQMHLASQDTIWYRYILEGVDRKWSDKTNQPFSDNYPNMAPGTYTFKVASVYRGKWSAPASFSFTILTPWWTSWWAWMIYIFGVFFLLRGYILYRGRRLLKENRVLEEKVALRTTQLQSSIEELKATQSQLIQSEKMASLGELTAGIAHEIQNPLNFINNFAEINKELLTELKDELTAGNLAAATTLADDVIANEEKINHHGRRADGIVKSMLQHSRSNQHSVKEPTDLNKLADEYLRLAYHGLRAKDKSFNASLKTAFDPAVGTVMLLGNDMGRVILNLITNAFYAVGERNAQAKAAGVAYEPTVTVTTRRLNGKVEVVVQDNGNGIPAAIRDKIFQPFFTTKPTGQGTGLGLSMSYEIVKKGHAGELKVESVEGQGTSFTIIIPS